MIKNLIFDLAGVVLNLNLERDTEALRSIGLPDFEECLKRPEIIKPMMAYLDGLVSTEVFLQTMHPVCKKDASDEDLLYAMDAVLDDIPRERLALIKSLRERFRVFLLSNIYESAWQYAVNEMQKSGYQPEDCFEKTFLSYKMKMAKPDYAIFKAVIEETGIDPCETLFFDDTKSNLQAAKDLGFNVQLVPANRLEDVINIIVEQVYGKNK